MADRAKKRSRAPAKEVPYTDDLPPVLTEHDVSQDSVSFTHRDLAKRFEVPVLRKNGWVACGKDLVIGRVLKINREAQTIVIKNRATNRNKTIPMKTATVCCDMNVPLREKATGKYFKPVRRDGSLTHLRCVLRDGAHLSLHNHICLLVDSRENYIATVPAKKKQKQQKQPRISPVVTRRRTRQRACTKNKTPVVVSEDEDKSSESDFVPDEDKSAGATTADEPSATTAAEATAADTTTPIAAPVANPSAPAAAPRGENLQPRLVLSNVLLYLPVFIIYWANNLPDLSDGKIYQNEDLMFWIKLKRKKGRPTNAHRILKGLRGKGVHDAIDFAIKMNKWPVMFMDGDQSYNMVTQFIITVWCYYVAHMASRPSVASRAAQKVRRI